MGGTIDFPAYIVLELPEPIASTTRRYRELFDKERSSLTAELTLTGSSGTGIISLGQSLDDVLALVDKTAAANEPFEAAFEKVKYFPSTATYYLSFREPAPFQRLHDAFAKSGIRFEPSPYPFTPHFTLKLHKEPGQEELSKLLSLKPPEGSFILDTVAVYCLPEPLKPELLHRVKLGSGRA